MTMRRLHLVGHSSQGKTSLAEALIAHWTSQGLRIGTIKHTAHRHELDVPGKDSWRHRHAGAEPAAIISADQIALHYTLPIGTDPYTALTPAYAGCDLVLVEGHLVADAPRVEVWRAAPGQQPLAKSHPGIMAVVSDDDPGLLVSIPVWSRRDLAGTASHLLALVGVTCP